MRKLMLLILMPLPRAPRAIRSASQWTSVGAVCDDRALGSFIGQAPTKENAIKLMGFSRARTLRWVPMAARSPWTSVPSG